ncbi:MAG: hypothetical protein IJ802_01605 [Kiritimatiellae bacterium]|nr:hypothetical protein [Kiritimatiellia bacterium]
MSSAAEEGSFTNHAGRVVSGELKAVTNGVVVIGTRSYPLSIFPEAERARIKAMIDVPPELPPHLAAARRSLRERYMRNEALLKSGAKSPEDAEATRKCLLSIWQRMLDEANLAPSTRNSLLSSQ